MRARPVRAALVALTSLLVTTLLVELGYRLWLGARGEAWDGAAARARAAERTAQMERGLADYGAGERPKNRHDHVLHPYAGFASEGLFGSLPRYVEAFGKRRARAYFDVVVVGGSVAGMTSRPLKKILPDRLAPHLPEGVEGTRVYNLAMGGIKQPQQTTLAAYLFARGIRPDAIVNVDGFNEVALGNQNGLLGADPVYPSVSHWAYLLAGPPPDRETLDLLLDARAAQREAAELFARADRWGLFRSAVTGRAVLARLGAIGARAASVSGALERRLAAQARDERTFGIPIPEERVEERPLAPVRLSVHAWFEASLSLDAMCDAREVLYLQVLQPTLHDAGSKALTPEEVELGEGNLRWIAGARDGYPILRERGPELVERGVNWLDASMLFADVEDAVYVDLCHYDERGNLMLAERIADELARLLGR